MPLVLTNTLSGKKETFVPLRPGEAKMYVCGPTVYGLTHIGNARPVVFFDVVRRYLEFSGFKTTYVSNYTDVDDKIIDRARHEKTTWLEIADLYVKEFEMDRASLNVQKPDHAPRATSFIPQIISFIERLVDKQVAYVASGGEVFFAVRKFADYGKLSKKNIDDLLVGVRIDTNDKKRDPLDFSLWKPRKAPDEPAWESPWGRGRPGWHIECSVMAHTLLGESFDIHGGGMDLIHPHHENEIAQSEGLNGKPFARFWLHNNFLNMGSEKMSKSLGNLFYTREFIKKNGAEVLKFLLLSAHYRSTIDFSDRHIRETQAGLHRIYSAIRKCESFRGGATSREGQPTPEEQVVLDYTREFRKRWCGAMDDDLNTPKLLGFLFDFVRLMNAYLDRKGFKPTCFTPVIVGGFLEQLRDLSSVLNLFAEDSNRFLNTLKDSILEFRQLRRVDIESQIKLRSEARARKDFTAADKIRQELHKNGIEIKDSSATTEWDVII